MSNYATAIERETIGTASTPDEGDIVSQLRYMTRVKKISKMMA